MTLKPLSESEVARCLKEAELWRLEKNEIKRIFLFQHFMDSIGFVNQIAAYAETVNHHPDITIQYNRVSLALSTHDANGLTEKDFEFAKMADQIFHRC